MAGCSTKTRREEHNRSRILSHVFDRQTAVALADLLTELHLRQAEQALPIYVDNLPAVRMVNAVGGTKLSKTIKVHHQYLRNIIMNAKLEVVHVPTPYRRMTYL